MQGTVVIILLMFSNGFTQPESDIRLTESNMKDWIKTRIETNKIQLEFKRNADQYDDLPVAYFKARNQWLESVGKDPEEWDEFSEWIYGVYSALDEQRDIDEEKSRLSAELEEIDNNEFLTTEQKEMMKSGMTQVLDKREEVLEPFRDDFPVAVKFEDTFNKLNLWISGNTADPPSIN